MNKETIEPYEICIPSIEKQLAAVVNVKRCHNSVQNIKSAYEQKIKSLASLKQSILKQAFNGELVKE